VAVLNDSDRFVFVGLSRGPRRGAFDSDELSALGRLAPHVKRAARVWVALGAAEEARRTIEAAFDHIAYAVFLTNAEGRIKFLNAAAAEVLAEGPALGSRGGNLACATEIETSRLEALIRAAASRSVAGRMKLALNESEPLSLLIVPLNATVARPAPRAEVMVIAIAPGAPMRAVAERLQQYFGLTRVEALLASHIMRGTGLKAAAVALNIAPTTARTHLNRIFDKTGARSQTALASLLGAGVALTRK
jgi:DNA-binding CsgD family transcriptional regulator